ncbi:sugar phosphate nucleotidyltransferase [Bacillus velezensis]|uniref:sugar phosphate nucleotidyltransferase n=1 Tax=Bacillus velezensis TaxID=492670 RepID=UPI0039AF8882
MKVVILAGGKGTRLSELTEKTPKPLIKIGGEALIIHIMNHYSSYGYNDFIVCLGYKNKEFKDFFLQYRLHNNDITIDFPNNNIEIYNSKKIPWKVTLIDTGLESPTCTRLEKIKSLLPENDPFMLTYGDGISDINLEEELKSHLESEKVATVCGVAKKEEKGILKVNKSNYNINFSEKPNDSRELINGGFFIFNYDVVNYFKLFKKSNIEYDLLPHLANQNDLNVYEHNGFWQSVDTLKDVNHLNSLFSNGKIKNK